MSQPPSRDSKADVSNVFPSPLLFLIQETCRNKVNTKVVFISARIAFRFTPSSAVQIYDFHIFAVVYSSPHSFIWNQHDDQLPVGLLAKLECCTGIAEVMGSIPVQA